MPNSKSQLANEKSILVELLAEKDSLFSAIMHTVPDAMIIIGEYGIIKHFSDAAEQLFGYSQDDIIGNNISLLMPTHDSQHHDEYIQHYLKTGEKRIIDTGRVVKGKRSDGSLFPMELFIGEAIASGHRVFTGFVRDLTEQIENEMAVQTLQAELAHASRLSSVGTLASTLAHELNQPLTAIANYMAAGRDIVSTISDEKRDFLMEAMDEAAKESVRAGNIVRRLREFVSKGEVDRHVESLGKVIGDATTLGLMGAGEKGISWSVDIDHVGEVVVDRIQIQQVLINLMRNAVEAMEECNTKHLTIKAHNISEDYAEVIVADTGPGLSPEIIDELFQPFVSTKSDGMGLGLSICRTIVEAHGGQLTTEPNQGEGTIFRFTLNRAERESGNG